MQVMLQWGHNFIVMEITEDWGDYYSFVTLQWDHNFIVMEIYQY